MYKGNGAANRPEDPEGSIGIALLFLDLGARKGGQHQAPADLPPGKTRYPLYMRLGWPQGRSGRASPTVIRSPDLPTRSQSLFRPPIKQ
jgi:hypothetical protein